jgi:hypothetical protein
MNVISILSATTVELPKTLQHKIIIIIIIIMLGFIEPLAHSVGQ